MTNTLKLGIDENFLNLLKGLDLLLWGEAFNY